MIHFKVNALNYLYITAPSIIDERNKIQEGFGSKVIEPCRFIRFGSSVAGHRRWAVRANQCPFEALEEAVGLDVSRASSRSQARRRVLRKQAADEVPRGGVGGASRRRREGQRLFHDVAERRLVCSPHEGGAAVEQLVE